MRTLQRRAFVEQDIDFDPDAVARVVRGDAFVAVDEGREAPGQVRQFLLETVVDGGAGEAEDVF
jgi:hypothetical protein